MLVYNYISLLSFQDELTADPISDVTSWTPMPTILQFLYLLVIFGVVVFLAFYTTKWIAKVKISKGGGRNSNVRIIDSVSVGQQGQVHLLKAGNQYILIGVTKERITYLSDVDPEELHIRAEPAEEYMAFDKIMKRMLPGKKDKESK